METKAQTRLLCTNSQDYHAIVAPRHAQGLPAGGRNVAFKDIRQKTRGPTNLRQQGPILPHTAHTSIFLSFYYIYIYIYRSAVH